MRYRLRGAADPRSPPGSFLASSPGSLLASVEGLEFRRRARSLFADKEAVVDGSLRFTYAQFFDRCDRWSVALQRLGVAPGDRVVYIAPNTYANLESFYAVPQIGAVLVPVNYRLIDSVAQAAIVQCDRERLSQAQLDCLLSVTEWANVREIGACDAIKAKHPSWLRGI